MAEIIREIGAIARALDSISNIEFKEVALTRGQYLYLVRICENPGIIQEKIAEMLKVDRTTTARALKNQSSITISPTTNNPFGSQDPSVKQANLQRNRFSKFILDFLYLI